MAETSEAGTPGGESVAPRAQQPRCLSVAPDGIKDSRDFANYMSALMRDLGEGLIAPGVGNAICNAGGKLLKVKELELRYGTVSGNDKRLGLSDGGLVK